MSYKSLYSKFSCLASMVELAWDMDAWTPIKKKKIPERVFLMTLDFPEQIQIFFTGLIFAAA